MADVSSPPSASALRVFGTVAAVGAVTGAGCLAWARVEAGMFRLRRVQVPVLAAGSAPVKVLHLSDLHLTPTDRRRAAWVRELAVLKPDLVVDTGDNLAHQDAVPTVLDALGPLLDVPGVFVLGSNDYFAPRVANPLRYFAGPSTVKRRAALPTGDLVSGLVGAGWVDLTNCRAGLEVAGQTISFVGVDDPHIRRDRYPEATGTATDVLRIGVVHAPYRRVLDAMTDEGSDLVLAGHTHGGQVCVPFVGALVTNCDLPRVYAKGLARWATPQAGTWLHVSAGLGSSPYARIRFACPPEATLLTLVPRT